MSKTLVLTDPHLFHGLVAELRGFETIEEHNAWFVDMYNSHVTKRDITFWLGDLTVGSGKATEAALSLVETLPGRKVFIAGNHDNDVNPHGGKAQNRINRWAQAFDFVGSQHTERVYGRYVNFSHFPYDANEHDFAKDGTGDRFAPYRVPDTGRWLVHGHSHWSGKYSGERQLHAGLDAWGRPVTKEEIHAFIEDAEAGRISIDPKPNGNVSVVRELH
jgi:calcineurin-like phosphoesterase family protein